MHLIIPRRYLLDQRVPFPEPVETPEMIATRKPRQRLDKNLRRMLVQPFPFLRRARPIFAQTPAQIRLAQPHVGHPLAQRIQHLETARHHNLVIRRGILPDRPRRA